MNFLWLHELDAALLSVLLAAMMTGAAFMGARLARTEIARAGVSPSNPAIETALLGLLGLLLAFTFSGAASRFDTRSHLMVEAASAIRTAVQRADFYPADVRAGLRSDLAEYIEAQGAFYRAEHDDAELRAAVDRIEAIRRRIWSRVAAASHDPSNALATSQMSNTLDPMFGVFSSREVASRNHMPGIVVALLFIVAIATTYVSGHASALAGSFRLASYAVFSILTALVVYVTLDLDESGRGIIRRNVQEQAIEAVGVLLKD